MATVEGKAGLKDWKEVQAWYLKTSKLALAIAIIRCKPSEKSSKEYAEYLSKVISERELNWRTETERLKGDVLRLRQELLLRKICPVNGDSAPASTSTSVCLSHGNSQYSSQPENDSGCDIPDEDGFEPAEMFQLQHNIINCLVVLGRCSLLKKHMVELLFCEINHFADELLHTCQNQTKYDIARYENIFSLCMVLEQIIQSGTEEKNTSSSKYEEIKTFLQKLDQIILNLSDEFPLFCLYIWRLGVLFNSHMQTDRNMET
uniref:Meiosis-specific protein MEI4 isoform X2 n=1 Tax=Geotrypetes seraphini TaxID=260995 RepID=A0A6P8QWG2_GEOSA|nr:meiosis-specific protein MEI4 isoform X2 [Geotrypetes seraphini]